METNYNCNKGFADSYMLLKPEKAGYFDLLHILTFRNISQRKFVESHAADDFNETLGHRWLIFISILAQKLLQLVAKPLSLFGAGVELFINFIALNGGVFRLLPNFIKGALVFPDPKSEKYLSLIGNLDVRVKLDATPGDFKYYPALSMMASKASYENEAFLKTTVEDKWKMEFVGLYNCMNEYQGKTTTQVLIVLDKHEDQQTYVVAFRGTEPFDADAWCTDLDISWYGIPGVGRIHGGFMKALGLQKNVGWTKEVGERDESLPPLAYYLIRDILRKALSENEKAKFIVTGHSLGGALSILFGTILCLHQETLLLERLEGIYTFGQPRVGDEVYAKYMKRKLKEHCVRYFRFVYCNDLVPRLPYDDQEMMFKHFGTCLFFNRRYELEVLEEQPNKNYFSPWCVIPMMLNAILELVRSFVIVYQSGPYYREGWILFGFRTIGIVIPGLPAHCPQDYINSTLLGTIEKHFKLE
ncbi:hypothetical protein LR48_Vigan1345s000700 [Vigna angularis]|uniref:Fungal lipase-type domain-containing protein n=1 Tax=Phaseolus angularis TaxID=3914 RepID=A0A0L9TIL9_PHAAN|nr:triacylglycerol lipase OBL1 [Vigna angularis]KOM30415.1 hypothetical protein LR48_Vigan1345s000700 [Vigna angularis]